jgi:putative hydrolase of the HAD superfamily
MLQDGIRAVFFDAVGTLLHPDPPAPLVYAEVGRRFGSRLDVGEITRRFTAAFFQEEALDYQNGLRTSEQREEQRWRRIVGGTLDDVTNPEACFRELYEHFRRPQAWRCDPEAGPLLEELHHRGLVLGMASNYDYRLRSVVAGLPELRHLQYLVISSEVGWRKPAPEFFASLCRIIGLPAGQILLLGDDRENDYDGARAAGLQPVLLDRREREPGLQRIRGLRELLSFLEVS